MRLELVKGSQRPHHACIYLSVSPKDSIVVVNRVLDVQECDSVHRDLLRERRMIGLQLG